MYPYLFNWEMLPMYGLLMMLGAAVAIIIAVFRKRGDDLKNIDVFLCGLFALVFGLTGAKLFSIIGNLKYVISGQISIVAIIRSGFVFYGGLIGGVGGALLYMKLYKIKVLPMMDALVVGVPLAHAMGRIGCFCAGCCYGKPTDSPIGIIFTHPLDVHTPVGVKLIPTQLIEAACLVLIFITLFIMSKKKVKAGVLTITYCLVYAVTRFIIEFFRGDVGRVFNNTLTGSQLISIGIILLVSILLIVYYFKIKKPRDKELAIISKF